MNKTKLLDLEMIFIKRYPGGFDHPDLQDLDKKYKMEAHSAFAQEHFAKENFNRPTKVLEAMTALVSKSAMVSMFEKPKLKDAVGSLTPAAKKRWTNALYELLHDDQEAGFENFVSETAKFKLAKWTLVTVAPAYFQLQKEIFVKPSTTKLVINTLELDLKYQARPTWDFYHQYRKATLRMRKVATRVKAPNNPAFTGFLMMTLNDLK